MTRTYAVLIERTVDDYYGDLAFVLLGFVDTDRPAKAMKRAARDHALTGDETMVAVPSRYWNAEKAPVTQMAMATR